VLRAVRAAGGTYPPAYVEDADTQIAEWLERYPAAVRLVALVDGAVVGHVQLVAVEATDQDLPGALRRAGIDTVGIVELARLFVSPARRGGGVGRALFDAASSAASSLGLRPALCVLVTQREAVALYRDAGWVELDSFVGVSGVENLVFVAPT
jgi:GNAT superfamily N-acetyltransferase